MHVNRINKAKGFTLVEILIVVVILGILAAIVVPQFAGAANEARNGNVLTQTQTLETQIELYAARNNGIYPDLVATWGSVGDLLIPETFVGGGYVKAPPVNPFSLTPGTGVVLMVAIDPAAADAAAEAIWTGAPIANANSWLYDRATGLIRAGGGNYIPKNGAGVGDP